jgi:hypothetical protein
VLGYFGCKKAVWAYGLDGRGEGGRRKVKKWEGTNGCRKLNSRESTRHIEQFVFAYSILRVASLCRLTIRQLCTVRTLCTLIKKKTKFSSSKGNSNGIGCKVIYEEGLPNI